MPGPSSQLSVAARVALLRAAFGAQVNDVDLAPLAASSVEWEAAPGERLMTKGAVASQGFVVIEGSATLDIEQQAIARLGPGSWIWCSEQGDPMAAEPDCVYMPPAWVGRAAGEVSDAR